MARSLTGETEFSTRDYQALSSFRWQIRRFLHFSQEAALSEGLEPQQHQMMLAIRATNEPDGPTIGELAEELLIRHHSAVGLVDRLVERGLVERARAAVDRRQVRVRLTSEGDRKLQRLSHTHRAELRQSGPDLVEALASLLR